jgi:hypothetical protein
LTAVIIPAQTPPKGKLNGRVFDIADPNKPIASAKVVVQHRKTPTPVHTKTESDGTYEITGLVPGETYDVTYSAHGYVERSLQAKVTATVNTGLSFQIASRQYLRQVASRMKERIQAAADTPQSPGPGSSIGLPTSSKKEVFTTEWTEFQKMPVSAEGKAVVANELESLERWIWSDSGTFLVYAQADPDKVAEAERLFASRPSDPTVMSFDKIILRDIRAAHESQAGAKAQRETPTPPKQKTAPPPKLAPGADPLVRNPEAEGAVRPAPGEDIPRTVEPRIAPAPQRRAP